MTFPILWSDYILYIPGRVTSPSPLIGCRCAYMSARLRHSSALRTAWKSSGRPIRTSILLPSQKRKGPASYLCSNESRNVNALAWPRHISESALPTRGKAIGPGNCHDRRYCCHRLTGTCCCCCCCLGFGPSRRRWWLVKRHHITRTSTELQTRPRTVREVAKAIQNQAMLVRFRSKNVQSDTYARFYLLENGAPSVSSGWLMVCCCCWEWTDRPTDQWWRMRSEPIGIERGAVQVLEIKHSCESITRQRSDFVQNAHILTHCMTGHTQTYTLIGIQRWNRLADLFNK